MDDRPAESRRPSTVVAIVLVLALMASCPPSADSSNSTTLAGPGRLENVTISPIGPDTHFDDAREKKSLLDKVLDFFSDQEIRNANWGILRLFIPSLLVLPTVVGFLYVWRRQACSEE